MGDLIKEIERFTRKAHKGQRQATGKPYIQHPLEVASLLKKWKQEDEVISAGILHDTVEDCDISLSEIKKKFGKRVAFLVDGMSWTLVKRGGKQVKDEPATKQKFVDYSKKDPSLVLIKLADMISNIPNIRAKSQRKFIIEKAYPRAKSFWLPFMKAVGFSEQAKRIEKEYNRYNRKRVNSVLYDYISKKDLKKIRNNLKHEGMK